jgi:hypothetical protein
MTLFYSIISKNNDSAIKNKKYWKAKIRCEPFGCAVIECIFI